MIQNNDTDWLRIFGERVDSIEDVPVEGAFEAIMARAAGARRRARARRTVALVAGLAAAAALSALFLLPKGAVDAPQNEGRMIAEAVAGEASETAGTVAAVETVEASVPEACEPVMQIAAAATAQLVAEAVGNLTADPVSASEPTAATEASQTAPASSRTATTVAASEPTAATEASQTTPASSLPATTVSVLASEPTAAEANPAATSAQPEIPAAALNRYIASLDDEKPRRRKFSIALNSGSTAVTERSSSYSVSLLFPKGTKIPNNEDDIFTTVIVPPPDIPQSGNGSEIIGFFFDIYEEKGKQVIAPQVIPEDKPVTEKEKYEERTASIGRSVSIPISAGITLSYDISPRFAIESGITFTLLSSTFSLDKRPVLSIDSYYAGIPLAVKAGIHETSHSDFYVRAGGMMEKCISSTEGGYYRNLIKADQINDGKILWSAFGYAGYQYRINGFWSVYFEPGVSCHFDSDNMGYTIYENNPCLFSLQAGLRFRL